MMDWGLVGVSSEIPKLMSMSVFESDLCMTLTVLFKSGYGVSVLVFTFAAVLIATLCLRFMLVLMNAFMMLQPSAASMPSSVSAMTQM